MLGYGLIKNNSIIRASSSGQIGKIECVSGSRTADVGMWIAPNGNDITDVSNDGFHVVVGNSSDPGHIAIALEDGYSLTAEDVGVYSCIIRDETGDLQQINVGIYLNSFNGLY